MTIVERASKTRRRVATDQATGPTDASNGTRATILEAARREFAERGLAGARIKAIAEHAGMNMQALYYHFHSKEGLYIAALEDGYSILRKEWSPEGLEHLPASEALRRFVEDFFDTLLRHREVVDLVTDENRHKGVHLQQQGSGIRDVNAPFVEAFSKILQRGIAEGEFRQGLDSIQTWISIVSLCQFYLVNASTLSHIVGFQVDSTDGIDERRRHVVEFVLSAVESNGRDRS